MWIRYLNYVYLIWYRLLSQDRSSLPDVPAVYFIEPTSENVKKCCEDLQRGLYDSYYINFSSTVPRPIMEELASTTIVNETSDLINQVYDQYLNFVCTNSDVFSLNQSEVFVNLNNPSAAETLIDETVDKTVNGLFSVIVTMGNNIISEKRIICIWKGNKQRSIWIGIHFF